MTIKYHKNFNKQFQKLVPKIQKKVIKTIDKFMDNPFDTSLKNHALVGRLKGKRAISVTGDIRIIFEEENSYITVFILDVGTHNQVYK